MLLKDLGPRFFMTATAWKVPVFGYFLVRIFPHSDWIRKDTPKYISVFSPNAEEYGQEKLRIRRVFTQQACSAWENVLKVSLSIALFESGVSDLEYKFFFLLNIGAGVIGLSFLKKKPIGLTYVRPWFLSNRNQQIHLQCKSIDWFLYDGKIDLKWVKLKDFRITLTYSSWCSALSNP